MKKALLIFSIFLNLLSFNTPVQAQCSTVAVSIYQPSAGNYKVRATIPYPYSQDIEIMGSITPEGGSTTGYELTIFAGNLTGETDQTWQQSQPPTISGTFSASVCPTASDYLNFAGQLHNDYQEYLLNYLTAGSGVDLTDTSTLKQIIQSKSVEFFQNHGITITSYPSYLNFANTGGNSYNYSTSGFSSSGASILNDLKSLIVNYDENNDAGFFSSLNSLQSQALSLSNPTEVYTVGIPVTIAIYSFNYWKNHADNWAQIFNEQDSLRHVESASMNINDNFEFPKGSLGNYKNFQFASYFYEQQSQRKNKRVCKVSLWKLGGADVGGGVSGGIWGTSLGPGGTFAGAVLGSSTSSLYNLSNQVISCYWSWWPF
jgi:hypothetical protein